MARTKRPAIDWMTIRDCSCGGAACIESDSAPGTFYPCGTCNPNWSRIAFEECRAALRQEEPRE